MSRAPHAGSTHARRAAGFTLIELMIVVAIIAILVAAAMAGYDFATVKARRATAKGCMIEAAQYMERFYTTNMRYDQTPGGVAVVLPNCSTDVTPFYAIGFVAGEPTATSFAIQAAPQGPQASSDTRCGTLTVDNTGKKGAGDDSDDTVEYCW